MPNIFGQSPKNVFSGNVTMQNNLGVDQNLVVGENVDIGGDVTVDGKIIGDVVVDTKDIDLSGTLSTNHITAHSGSLVDFGSNTINSIGAVVGGTVIGTTSIGTPTMLPLSGSTPSIVFNTTSTTTTINCGTASLIQSSTATTINTNITCGTNTSTCNTLVAQNINSGGMAIVNFGTDTINTSGAVVGGNVFGELGVLTNNINTLTGTSAGITLSSSPITIVNSCGTASTTLSTIALSSNVPISAGTNSMVAGLVSASTGVTAPIYSSVASGVNLTMTTSPMLMTMNVGTTSPSTVTISSTQATSSVPISCGTNAITCGTLSVNTISSFTGSNITCTSLTTTSGDVITGTGRNFMGTNFRSSSGNESLTFDESSTSATLTIVGSPPSKTCTWSNTGMLTNAPISCGTSAMTCGALTPTTVDTGTYAMTTGSLSCTTISTTTNDRIVYELRTQQTISTATVTTVLYDTSVVNIGNITFNTGVFTVPSTGIYMVMINDVWANSAVGQRQSFFIVNNSDTNRYASVIMTPLAGVVEYNHSWCIALSANDNIRVNLYQNSGGNLGYSLTSTQNQTARITIYRIA